jgi:hypothetical protein
MLSNECPGMFWQVSYTDPGRIGMPPGYVPPAYGPPTGPTGPSFNPGYPNGTASSPLTNQDMAAGQMVDALVEISRCVDELRGRLDHVFYLIKQATVVTANEVEMGALFVRAQAFIEDTVSDVQKRASQILSDARANAYAILADAQSRADEIVYGARAPLSAQPNMSQHVSQVTDSVRRATDDLTNELAQLGATLRSSSQLERRRW